MGKKAKTPNCDPRALLVLLAKKLRSHEKWHDDYYDTQEDRVRREAQAEVCGWIASEIEDVLRETSGEECD